MVKIMTQNLELKRKCEAFRKELERRYKLYIDDSVHEGFYEYIGYNNTDFEFTIASDGTYKSVKLQLLLDGTHICIDTAHNTITCVWDFCREVTWLPLEIAYEIDTIYEEIYLTVIKRHSKH